MIGISRVRNEALILEDTLRHYLGFCDEILLYDDCSTDQTVEIAESYGRVTVLRGYGWSQKQAAAETRHRALLLQHAKATRHQWCLCFDADERLEGELPPLRGDAWTFRLFDGYITPETPEPYTAGPLVDLPRRWGPEYRDIAMLFRMESATYDRPGQREPIIRGVTQKSDVLVRHYGKCLSVDHWEDTCDFYAQCFPQWRSKWLERKGKAVHTESDFGRPLYDFDGAVENAVNL